MLKVGLTGGIGCGKTTVARHFSEMNVPIIDADAIAHHLVEPGQPALLSLIEAFGDKILHPDGSLNRDYLRDIVFSDLEQKQKLEHILHPLVFVTMKEAIDQLDYPYCIVSIPLLFETRRNDFVDRILVIDCPVKTQIERVKRRDNLTEARIQSIIDSQVNRDFRLKHCNDVIDNCLSSSGLAEQVKKLHNLYLSISAH